MIPDGAQVEPLIDGQIVRPEGVASALEAVQKHDVVKPLRRLVFLPALALGAHESQHAPGVPGALLLFRGSALVFQLG